MNRRQLLAGIAALPLASVPAIAAVKISSIEYGINLLGMKVSYTKEFAEDLVATHGLHPTEIIEKMYGNKFWIEKEKSINPQVKPFLTFNVKTDDERDNFTGWMVYVDEHGKLEYAYWNRIDSRGDPTRRWFRNWGASEWTTMVG